MLKAKVLQPKDPNIHPSFVSQMYPYVGQIISLYPYREKYWRNRDYAWNEAWLDFNVSQDGFYCVARVSEAVELPDFPEYRELIHSIIRVTVEYTLTGLIFVSIDSGLTFEREWLDFEPEIESVLRSRNWNIRPPEITPNSYYHLTGS